MAIQKQTHLNPQEVADYLIKNKAATFGNLASNFNVSTDFIRGFILGNPRFEYVENIGFAKIRGLGDELCFGCGDETWRVYTSKIVERKYHGDCVGKLFLNRKPSENVKIQTPEMKEKRKVECGICAFSEGERTQSESNEWCTKFYDGDGKFESWYRPYGDERLTLSLGYNGWGFEVPACQFLEPASEYKDLIPKEFLERQEVAKRATMAFMKAYSLPREILPENIKLLMQQFRENKTLPETETEKIENFVNQESIEKIENALKP